MALIQEGKFQQARQLLEPAAEAEDRGAQALLGQIHQAGWGVPSDYALAFKWWSRAAEAGSGDAQWGLGLLYDNGLGVTQDSGKAAMWWAKAAEQGNIKATVNLAFLFEEGRGVAQNQTQSANLFKQAAEAGEPFAQAKYGLRLLLGEGVEPDEAMGCAWIAVAADSDRIKDSTHAAKFSRLRDETWNRLSASQRHQTETFVKGIQERFKSE